MEFTIHTHNQLKAAAPYLPIFDSVQSTFQAIASRCNFQDKSYSSNISYQQIQAATGFSESTVIRHVRMLAQMRIIDVRHQGYICSKTGQRRQASNRYSFNLELIKSMASDLINKVSKPAKELIQSCKAHVTEVVSSHSPSQLKRKKRDHDDPIILLTQLQKAARYSDKHEAWTNRGRRYYCNADGGLYINKQYADTLDIRGLVGVVSGSLADAARKDCISMIENYQNGLIDM